MLTYTLIYAGLLPLVVAALAAFASQRLSAAPKTAWMSGVALGYIAAQFGLKSHAGLAAAASAFIRPQEAADWLPLIVLLAWAIGLLLNNGWRPARLVAVAFAFAVPVRLLASNAHVSRDWSLIEKVGYLSLLAALIGFVWLLLATDDEEQPSSGRFVCVVLVAVGIAIVLTLSGVLVYGLLSAALAAALTGAALACISGATAGSPSSVPLAPASISLHAPSSHHLAPPSSPGATGSASASQNIVPRGFTGAAGITACVLVGLIILGHFYAELSTTNTALLVAALIIASAPLPKPLTGHPAWLHSMARILLCLVPIAIAILSLAKESSPY